MSERREYEITQEQLDALIEAGKPTPAMWLSGGTPLFATLQENANRAWEALGDDLGFDWATVEASSKGQRFFLAVPLERKECPTCGSHAPHLHPAVQHEGEVQPCGDAFHLTVTPENTPERIAKMQETIARITPSTQMQRVANIQGAIAAAKNAYPDASWGDLLADLEALRDEDYLQGFVGGIEAYAYSSSEPWARNGVQYVGTTGKTLAFARLEVEKTYNYSPPSRR